MFSTRPRRVYEGAFASLNPYANLPSPVPGGLTAGLNGLVMGRFGWVNPLDGTVDNTYTPGYTLGFVLPRFGLWSLEYWQRLTDGSRVLTLRPGKMVTLAGVGDFYARFPAGSIVGAQVFADPSDGRAYTDDGGGFRPTSWRAMQTVGPGDLAIISPWLTAGE